MPLITVGITTWPNHPKRLLYFCATVQNLLFHVNWGGYTPVFKVYAEAEKDPNFPWMGEALRDICADMKFQLSWSEGKPNLGATLNQIHREMEGDLLFYLQDDWLLLRPLEIDNDANILLGDERLAGIRYWANTRYMNFQWHDKLVVDNAAPWAYGDNPALWHRRFFKTCGPFDEGGPFGTHEYGLCGRLPGCGLAILAPPEMAESCVLIFKHIGKISSLPNEHRWPDADRRKQS